MVRSKDGKTVGCLTPAAADGLRPQLSGRRFCGRAGTLLALTARLAGAMTAPNQGAWGAAPHGAAGRAARVSRGFADGNLPLLIVATAASADITPVSQLV